MATFWQEKTNGLNEEWRRPTMSNWIDPLSTEEVVKYTIDHPLIKQFCHRCGFTFVHSLCHMILMTGCDTATYRWPSKSHITTEFLCLPIQTSWSELMNVDFPGLTICETVDLFFVIINKDLLKRPRFLCDVDIKYCLRQTASVRFDQWDVSLALLHFYFCFVAPSVRTLKTEFTHFLRIRLYCWVLNSV